MAEPRFPKKPYFRIGEVARMLGVETHVIRYWESEFPQFRPRRAPSRHRIFLPADVALLQTIKRLLYEEGFTLAGAKRHLAAAAAAPAETASATAPPAPAAGPEPSPEPPREVLAELKDILNILR